VCNGKTVLPSTIDWEKEGLNVFYGFDNTKNVYVFNSDEEMIKWAEERDIKRAEEIKNVLENIATAQKYAEETGELDREETSEEFENYMKENFSSGNKGLGRFFHEPDFKGDNFLISAFPKRKLSRSNDDKASSLIYLGNTMRMSSEKNWKGTQSWIWTINVIPVSDLASFDNKLSSYWNW
jgi:hypothetical protein